MLTVTACQTKPPPPASQYHAAVQLAPVALSFRPGYAKPREADLPALAGLAPAIPAQALPLLFSNGPLATARADAVGRILQRPVRPVLDPAAPPDQAVLTVPVTGTILADACRGTGGALPDGLWPGNDGNPTRLLPPGCAVETSIQAQTSQASDLLYGRPLPPGAALPYAQAIERYYRRNDAPRATAQQDQGAQSGASGDSGQGAGSAGGSGQAANPLLGPVPNQQAQGQR